MIRRASAWATLALALASLPIARADQVQYLAHATEGLAAFHALARDAERSIDLANFIFEPCHPSTQVLLETLAEKAKNGVRVRILLDSFMQGGAQKKNLAAYFAKNNIEFKLYNDYAIVHPGINLRLHAKMFVADGAHYIAGGRNEADEYFSLAEENFLDRDLLVSGASAKIARAYFNELWKSTMVSRPSGDPSTYISWKKFCPNFDAARVKAVRTFVEQNIQRSPATAEKFECSKVEFTVDSPEFGNPMYGPDRGSEEGQPSFPDSYMTEMRLRMKRATDTVLRFIAGTKARLELENWSYMPTGLLDEALTKLRDSKRRIRVVTNRDMDGPKFYRQAMEYSMERAAARDAKGTQSIDFLSQYGALKDNHELSPRNAIYRLHGKVAVRDNKDVLVSSFNLDPRSYNTNVESLVMVKACPALAAKVQTEIDLLHSILAADIASGTLPEKEEASFGAKVFAMLGLAFF